MPSSHTGSSVRLPSVYAIGFASDGGLSDEVMCRTAIGGFLAEHKSVTGRLVCGVSGGGPGGALIFAESCVALGIPLRLLLPLPRDKFLSDCSVSDKARLEHVLERAISVEIAGSEESPNERHYECGLQIVQQCQELLGVWDDEPSLGLGEIVEYAGQTWRPVTRIHSETGVVESIRRQSERKTGSERELDFLNHLPLAGVSLSTEGATALGGAWLAKLDANAAHLAPEVRRLAALPIICTALAAFVSAAAQGRHTAGPWIAAGAVLGLTAGFLPAALKLASRQSLWVRIRTAAEVSRSMLALWDTPIRYQVVGPEILPELNSMIRSLNFLKAEASKTTPVELAKFKQQYIEARLMDQVRYFSKQATRAARTGRRYRFLSQVGSTAATVASVWMFSSRYMLKPGSPAAGGSWMPLLASALFQIATIAGALLVVNECERRERRYREIHHALSDWEVELRAFHSWTSVMEVVSKVERALLVELLEWRSLLQNMKMPRS